MFYLIPIEIGLTLLIDALSRQFFQQQYAAFVTLFFMNRDVRNLACSKFTILK